MFKFVKINILKYIFTKEKENMQNYAQIGDIDHYSLHKIFIILVIT